MVSLDQGCAMCAARDREVSVIARASHMARFAAMGFFFLTSVRIIRRLRPDRSRGAVYAFALTMTIQSSPGKSIDKRALAMVASTVVALPVSRLITSTEQAPWSIVRPPI